MKYIQQTIVLIVLFSLAASAAPLAGNLDTFNNIELVQANGDNLRETSVRVVFDDTAMRIVSRSNGAVLKEWNYDTIKSAEYSYTKNPPLRQVFSTKHEKSSMNEISNIHDEQ